VSDRRQLNRSRLSEQIADMIRNDVLTGQMNAGEHVGQTQWAERVGASRMPVRDAINQLCAEGILVQDENGSASVAPIDLSDIRDGYRLNAFVASMAANRAAERITDNELVNLERILESMEEAVRRDDRGLASRHNWAFHAAINRAARSARLTAILRNPATSLAHSALEVLDEWPSRAIAHHREVLEALKAHDGEEAERLMYGHIVAGSEPMLERLEQRLLVPSPEARAE
jgi:DNA-binding GntR family transcriptional regulator